MGFIRFLQGCARLVTQGGKAYWAWIAALFIAIGIGMAGYAHQFQVGLIATNMRDQITWAFYIGNFTFLVGVAAAAVLLVVPAYVYHWKPIKEVVVLGELLAISAITMCCSSSSWTWDGPTASCTSSRASAAPTGPGRSSRGTRWC